MIFWQNNALTSGQLKTKFSADDLSRNPWSKLHLHRYQMIDTGHWLKQELIKLHLIKAIQSVYNIYFPVLKAVEETINQSTLDEGAHRLPLDDDW